MAAGDCCILREATAGGTDNSNTWADYDWDTEVYRDSGSFSLSGTTGIQCLTAAPHLVIYNSSYEGTGTNRSELANRIEVNGTRTLSGQTTAYIRRSGDSFSSQCGIGLIEASANDVVTIARARTDSNTGGATCTRQALECGFQVVELDDSWAYFRGIDLTTQSLTHASGESPPVTAASYEWQDVQIRTEFRKDTGYIHSTTVNPAEITLDGARRYLILYNVKFNNPSGSVRVNGLARLVYDGVQVPASVSTAYARGSDGCQDPIACGAVLYSPAGRNRVLKLQAACDQEGTGTLDVNEASIDIIDLGTAGTSGIEVAILRQSADHDHDVSRKTYTSPITWDTQDALDTGSFGHSTSTDPERLEVKASGRVLCWSAFAQGRTAVNGIRKRPRVEFRQYVPALTAYQVVQYGYGDNFNRGDQSTTSTWMAGGIGGGVMSVVADNRLVAYGCCPASPGGDQGTAWLGGDCALFAIDLSTMSPPDPITGTLSTSTPATTASFTGTYTPPPITGTVTATTPSTLASFDGTYTPGALTGTVSATTPAVTAQLDGTRGLPSITGTLAATTPVVTAQFVGTYTPETITGTLAATTPAVEADFAGANGGAAPISGALDATTPAVTAAFDGVFPAPLTGTIELDTPAVTADFAGTYLAPITGAISASTPSLIAGFVATKSVDPVTGTLSATVPAVTASFTDAVRAPGIQAGVVERGEKLGAFIEKSPAPVASGTGRWICRPPL